jgi:hypothetical protein
MSQFEIFNQAKSLDYDKCYIQVEDLQNQSINNYMMNNYFMGSCGSQNNKESKSINQINQFAMDNGMVSTLGYGNTNFCEIEKDNDVRNGKQLTHDKNKRQLFKRIFEGIPNLNKGGLICDIQSKIQIGDDTRNDKPCNSLSGISTLDLQFYPMLDCVAQVQNPKHIINEGFLGGSRIGVGTRLELDERCQANSRK